MSFAEYVNNRIDNDDIDRLGDWEEDWLRSGAVEEDDSWPELEEEVLSDDWYYFPLGDQ